MTMPAITNIEETVAPRVSVVIPVFNGGTVLDQCLSAIANSSLRPFEILLIDDASTDGMTAAAAAKHGIRLVRLEHRQGPAAARNVGVEAAQGEIIFFTDADVLLASDAIDIAIRTLVLNPQLSAVFGSYDDAPGYSDFLSQYRNLYHHWVHQVGNPEASTFWTGCGAIWRSVLLALGGFRESYGKPSIEDIELGTRLRASGFNIRLEKSMLGKHMKQWKLWNLVRTDLLQRGVPWMVLVLQQRQAPSDLNLNITSRIATLLAAAFTLSLAGLVISGHAAAILPALALLLAGICSAWISGATSGQPVVSAPTSALTSTLLLSLALAAPLGLYKLNPDPWAILPVVLIVALVLLQLPFYRYLARKRSTAFALAAIPMQLMFFLCCAAAIPLGFMKFWLDGSKARTGVDQPAMKP